MKAAALRNTVGLTAIASLALALVGCVRPQVVPCPEPPALETPAMEYPKLPPEASLREEIVALVRDWYRWEGFSKELQTALNAYRKAEPAKKAEEKK